MKLEESISKYLKRNNIERLVPKTVLFDMDGVLYDSISQHAKAWKGVCDEAGIEAEADEFFAYEGRTGASTIDILIRRQFGRPATEEECRSLYRRKTELFADQPSAPVMHGAQGAVAAVVGAGLTPVLVTGSGQGTLLERLDRRAPCRGNRCRQCAARRGVGIAGRCFHDRSANRASQTGQSARIGSRYRA